MTPIDLTCPGHDTGDLLQSLADDTRDDLRDWTRLATCLGSAPPSSELARIAVLASDAAFVLRTMHGKVRAAQRAYRMGRFDRCLRQLKHFQRLRRTLRSIDRDAALAVLGFIIGGKEDEDGRRG